MKYFTLCFLSSVLLITISTSGFIPLPLAGELKFLAKLPNAVSESSGIEVADKPGMYWTHNDAGGLPILFKIDEKGKLLTQVRVPNTQNTDWEDLTRDTKGFLYIADTGDNGNKRKQLTIYKVSTKGPARAQAIAFTYPDLPKGKIAKEDRNFDCEAIFWHNSKLYLISKDRGAQKTAKLYELPDKPGTYTAKLIAREPLPGMVTSADLSPTGQHLAVISFGKIYLYPVAKGSTQFFKQEPRIIDLFETGQIEAVAFKNATTLVLTNEDGELYQYTL